MAKEFLVETWDPLTWIGEPELAVMSTVPLENLLEGRQVEDATDILLMGMEDIGHFLKTIGSLKKDPKRASHPELRFQVIDSDAVGMARNCLMLEIALTIDIQNKDDLSFLWCVWYNMELSQAHYTRLLGCLKHMVEFKEKNSGREHSTIYYFGNERTRQSCIEVWRAWMREEHSVEVVSKHRNRAINALDPTVKVNSTQHGMKVPEYAGRGIKVWDILADSIAFRWTGCIDPKDMEECAEEIKSWCIKGSALPKSWGSISGKTVINPTMMRPGKDEWYGYQDPGPFMIKNQGQSRPEVQKSAIDVCGDAFEQLLIDFREHVGATQIQVTLWHDDYMKQCLSGFQPGTVFGIIHTGGIIPAFQPASIFLVCAPLLKNPTSVLLTAVIHTIRDEGYDNVTSFLKDYLGFDPLMLPTLFGVHLAEDDNLGATVPTLKTPSLLRWTKANEIEKGKLCLEESPQVKEAMQVFFRKCFIEELDGRDADGLKTPLTALSVLMRLESHVLGGMPQLLKMTEELRPPWTTSREDPFHLSWRAQLAAHGYLDLARVHGDDELLHIRTTLGPPITKRHLLGSTGRTFSQLVLVEGNIEQLARTSYMAGPVFQFEMTRRLVEEMPKHIFRNFKYHEATQVVEWLMLKSDWINLAPTTMVWLDPNDEMRIPLTVKDHSTIQTVWKVQQKTDGRMACSVGSDNRQLSIEVTIKLEVQLVCWKIIKIREFLESFSVYLKVLESVGTVKAETNKGENPYARTNKLELCISDMKRSIPRTVAFSCNIDTTGVRLTVTDQRITAEVPKHKLWNKGLAMLPQLPMKPENLPPISRAKVKQLLEDDGLLASMFLRPGDLLAWKNGLTVEDLPFRFKHCLEHLWKVAYKEPQGSVVGINSRTDTSGMQLDLVIKGYYLYNGLPLMHVVYQDVRVGQALLLEGNVTLKQLKRKKAERLGHKFEPAVMATTGQETIDLLKEVLLLNSFRLKQPIADTKLGISESFLQLYFPRFARLPVDHMGEVEMVAKVLGDLSTCTSCGKKRKTNLCSRCKKVYYCSKECQRLDWPKHKMVCKPASSGKTQSQTEEKSETSAKKKSTVQQGVTQNRSSQEAAAGPVPETRATTADIAQSPLSEATVFTGHQSGVQKSPAKETSRPKQSQPTPECKICHKSGEDLQARLVYYCSIKCHQKDSGKTYPVPRERPHPDPQAEGGSDQAGNDKDSLEGQPTAATKTEVTQKKHCDFCGRRSATSVPCKQCSQVNYCSSSCATADWPVHSIECQK